MQLFSADPTMFKKKLSCFFAHKKLKKPPSKVAQNSQIHFFFPYCPDCPNGPDLHFRFIKNPMQPSVCWSGMGTYSKHASDDPFRKKQ